MYGKDINKWLTTEEKPEAYDFTEEIVDSIGQEDAIDRYVIYQATAPTFKNLCAAKSIREGHEVFSWKDDADGCELIEKIYGVLWSKALLVHCRKSEGVTGDTMNSPKTTMNELLKIETGDKSIKETIIRYANEENGNKLLKKSIQKYTHAEAFLNTAYTIGNFIPVPVGCNAPRGTGPTKDYWDLALRAIYQWYMKRDDAMLKDMLKSSEDEDRVRRYIYWLDSFGTWDSFVIANYMQDFVKKADPEQDAGIFGCPKELWDGHFDRPQKKPTEDKHFESFFSRATAWISARSVRMVNALRAKGDSE